MERTGKPSGREEPRGGGDKRENRETAARREHGIRGVAGTETRFRCQGGEGTAARQHGDTNDAAPPVRQDDRGAEKPHRYRRVPDLDEHVALRPADTGRFCQEEV